MRTFWLTKPNWSLSAQQKTLGTFNLPMVYYKASQTHCGIFRSAILNKNKILEKLLYGQLWD